MQKSTFLYSEPIGGAKPKFAQRTDGLKLVQNSNEAISLSCPAQGSPLPSFRQIFLHYFGFLYLFVCIEPIGGAKPKFAQQTNGLIKVQNSDEAISLSCPAQGSPLPSFRQIFNTILSLVLLFLQSLQGEPNQSLLRKLMV